MKSNTNLLHNFGAPSRTTTQLRFGYYPGTARQGKCSPPNTTVETQDAYLTVNSSDLGEVPCKSDCHLISVKTVRLEA